MFEIDCPEPYEADILWVDNEGRKQRIAKICLDDAPVIDYNRLQNVLSKLLVEAANKQLCPECGRHKARSVDDISEGKCPKWYYINDPAAEIDCIRHEKLNTLSHMLDKCQ